MRGLLDDSLILGPGLGPCLGLGLGFIAVSGAGAGSVAGLILGDRADFYPFCEKIMKRIHRTNAEPRPHSWYSSWKLSIALGLKLEAGLNPGVSIGF